ncbi:phosphatidylglycerophosphatase A [methane-oxidizing endosymbiont of Gigantopelta aegis]
MFRILDILKPCSIKWADRKVQGSFGIMLDNVLTGWADPIIFANVC